jgi:hypothetical protein
MEQQLAEPRLEDLSPFTIIPHLLKVFNAFVGKMLL